MPRGPGDTGAAPPTPSRTSATSGPRPRVRLRPGTERSCRPVTAGPRTARPNPRPGPDPAPRTCRTPRRRWPSPAMYARGGRVSRCAGPEACLAGAGRPGGSLGVDQEALDEPVAAGGDDHPGARGDCLERPPGAMGVEEGEERGHGEDDAGLPQLDADIERQERPAER